MKDKQSNPLFKLLIDAIYIAMGCSLLSFAITVILKPNNLITGGTTGFAIVLEKVTGIDYTVLFYGLSVIILLVTYFVLGKGEAKKIVLLSLMFPLVLMAFSKIFADSPYNLTKGDMFLSAVYYGVLAGAGVGLFLKRGFSSGGTDSIAKMLHVKVFPFVSISQLLASVDVFVLFTAIFVFDIRTALYALVTQIVFMKSVEAVLYGFSPSMVKLEIISEEEAEIETYILRDIKRGITKYNIVGGYSNLDRIKLVTICSQRESMLIVKKVADVDEKAFVSAVSVSSVWGKGVGFDSLTIE